MAASTTKSEIVWKAKLTRTTWECECVRPAPAESAAGEGEPDDGARLGPSVRKATEEVVTLTLPVCFVDFLRAGSERIRFRVNPLKNGRFTFSDQRDRKAGTEGTTGMWGTLPAPRASRPRSLTPTAFKLEAARFVGEERAEETVREVLTCDFFSSRR